MNWKPKSGKKTIYDEENLFCCDTVDSFYYFCAPPLGNQIVNFQIAYSLIIQGNKIFTMGIGFNIGL